MSSLPLVSVIILSYNNRRFLENCLESVFRSNYTNLELIFVDNASTDGSVAFVRKRFGSKSSLIIVQNSENLGYAGGNNAGLRFARGEYIVFLNNDAEVTCNWLRELITVLESDQSIGAAQGKLLSMYDRERIDHAGGFIDCLGFSVERGFREKDKGQYDKQDEVFYATGAAFAVRRSVLDKVGFLDEDFFLYYEETDLCWRIWLSGYRIVFVPKSVVFHANRATVYAERCRKNLLPEYHKHKNQITMLLKNYDTLNLIQHVPVTVFLKILSDFASFRSDGFIRFRGILYNIRYLSKTWRKRTKVQRIIRRTSDAFFTEKTLILSFNLRRLKMQNADQLKSEDNRSAASTLLVST